MLLRILLSLLKNIRLLISIALVGGSLFLFYTQYQAIKQSSFGSLIPDISLPNLGQWQLPQQTGTPTVTPTSIPENIKVSITTPKGKITYTAETAITEEEQALGLMYRTSLPQYSGMYFLYNQDVQHGFWMKNCEIPLDIIFIDNQGKIIDIRENLKPCKELDPTQQTCPAYVPKSSYRTVLEINGGSAKSNGITVGQQIETSLN